MYHTRESSNVPIFNQYCWNIPSAYENFTHRGSKLFFHFLLTTNINFIEHFNHRRSLSLPLDGLKGVERGKSLVSSSIADYSLATVPVFQERDPIDFGGKRFCKRAGKKSISFSRRESWITKRYISIFLKRGTVSSREYGTLCDTSAALRNVARWVSMSCHANDYSPKTSTLRYSDDEREWEILWCLMIVVTIFFNFKKLLRWLIIKEVFFFWLIARDRIFLLMKKYIYIFYTFKMERSEK